MKKISTVVLAILFVMVLAPFAMAAEQAAAGRLITQRQSL